MIETKYPSQEERYHVKDRDAATKVLRPLALRERLATLRSMFDLSQQEASALVKAGRNAWGNWEAPDDSPRKTYPGRLSRVRLARVFNLPESMFVED